MCFCVTLEDGLVLARSGRLFEEKTTKNRDEVGQWGWG